MVKKKRSEPPVCPLCHEPALHVAFYDFFFKVQCIECGTFEIMELAAKHIQEHPLEVRRRLLERAQLAAEGQDGPALIREPFTLG